MKTTIKNELFLFDVPSHFSEILCEELTIPNPQYLENKKHYRWNGNTPKKLYFYKREQNNLLIPRGFIDQLKSLCKEHSIPLSVINKTRNLPEINFNFVGKLKPFQEIAVDDMLNFDFGTLSAPTGSGKTVIALFLIAQSKQPALIIVHTTDLLNQWIQRIETFLGTPARNIGIIGAGQKRIGKKITVALVQSLYKCVDKVAPHIGYLIVDECHRVPSRTFTQAVVAFDSRYTLGLSATTYRRDGLSRLIFLHLGDMQHEINRDALIKNGDILAPEIITRKTNFKFSYELPSKFKKSSAKKKGKKEEKPGFYTQIISKLIKDPERNYLICSDTREEVKQNNICLILSDRKEHCQTIQQILNTEFGIKAELLTGDIPIEERKIITEKLNKKQIKVLIATGQLIGEGFDCKILSVLFLATPIRFSGRVIQYVGRILRPAKGKEKAKLYDYVDIEIGILRTAARERKKALTGEG